MGLGESQSHYSSIYSFSAQLAPAEAAPIMSFDSCHHGHHRATQFWFRHSSSQFSSNMNLTARCPRSHSASKPHFQSIAAMLSTTRALSTSPATAGCPAHRTMPSPTHRKEPPTYMKCCLLFPWIFFAPFSNSHSVFLLCIAQVSAVPAISPRMPVYVLCMQLDAERIEGKAQSASVVSTVRHLLSVLLSFC
jgi:hypothetical protein